MNARHYHEPVAAGLAIGYTEALLFAAGLAAAAFVVSAALTPAHHAKREVGARTRVGLLPSLGSAR